MMRVTQERYLSGISEPVRELVSRREALPASAATAVDGDDRALVRADDPCFRTRQGSGTRIEPIEPTDSPYASGRTDEPGSKKSASARNWTGLVPTFSRSKWKSPSTDSVGERLRSPYLVC